MCLITKQKEPIILKEDLEVYKIVEYYKENVFVSPFNYFVWKLKKKYKTHIEFENYDFCFFSDEEGDYFIKELNFQPDALFSEVLRKITKEMDYTKLSKGFHSLTTLERAKRGKVHNSEVIVKCRIPKGSQVYYGPVDQVVSNQLIVLEEVKC